MVKKKKEIKKILKKMKYRGGIAISQIFILVVGIIAISYAIGSGVGVVSGSGRGSHCIKYKRGNDWVIGEYNFRAQTTPLPGLSNCKEGGYGEPSGDTINYYTKHNSGDGANFLIEGDNGWWYCTPAPELVWKKYTNQNFEKEVITKDTLPCADVFAEAGDTKLTSEDEVMKLIKEFLTKPSLVIPGGEGDRDDEEVKGKSILERCRDQDYLKEKGYSTTEECMKAVKEIEKDEEPPTEDEKKDEKRTNLTEKDFTWFDAIWAGFTQAGKVYAGVKGLGMILGLDESLVDAASLALGAGAFVKEFFTTRLKSEEGRIYKWFEKSKFRTKLGWSPEQFSLRAGAAVAVIIFLIRYKQKNQEIISFECLVWDAPTGGAKCEDCNKQGILPCSEYQCRSLGQSCELLNKGTDEEKCEWINKNDVDYPTIEPWEDALLDPYKYVTQNTGISPPDRGVKVEHKTSTTGCVEAFTPLSFGVTLNEPAKCKIDYIRKESFDDMDFYFGGSSLHRYNHTQIMSLPGSAALEAEGIEIENDGNYSLYVRCQDANGNSNPANFVFKFCVEKGPDTTPPLIVGTTPLNGRPIKYNETEFAIEVYVNEPADCKWSHTDEDYNNMKENMSCSEKMIEMNAQMLYTCTTTLTGLKSRQENEFYFRCKDQPTGINESDRNVNIESYEFTLIGTQPLIIDYVKPENGSLIKDSTEVIKVTLEAKTSAGYKEGEALCEFGEISDGIVDDQFTPFWTHQHSYDLWLEGSSTGISYEYFIRCCDLGNNCDNETVNFEVETDLAAPVVVRAYHEDKYLKLVTNEPARCVYDVKSEYHLCDYDFEHGISMTPVGEDDVNHYTDWDTKITFYIKCRDEYGTQPESGCSIIVRPFESY